MSFTGKATYSAGTSLPEIAEDVSDLIGIVSPYETPLLDALGDPLREARSSHHEWLEDELLPNKDAVDDSTFTDPVADTDFVVDNGSRFRVGDQIQIEGSEELMLVTGISTNTLTVVRGYAGTTAEDLADNQVVNILGNAALEGDSSPTARFTNRARSSNYTQIFTAAVEVSGTDMAANQLGLADEMDYQKQERLRELIRNLENTVINGGQPASNPQGSGSDFSAARRSMCSATAASSNSSAGRSSIVIAPCGHEPRQLPRPSHRFSAIRRALPSVTWMAPSAQSGTQAPQPSHLSSSIRTIFRV